MWWWWEKKKKQVASYATNSMCSIPAHVLTYLVIMYLQLSTVEVHGVKV